MAAPPPTYTREEMDAILKRALERQQAKSEEISHEDLIAAAGEVGIPREDIEAAARDLEAEKAKRGERATPRANPSRSVERGAVDEARAHAVRAFFRRAVTFFGLSMFFFFIGHETGTRWWMWPVLGMALSLVARASRVFFGPNLVVGFGRLPAKAAPDEPQRGEERTRREERLADFERKVAIGADALVRVIDEARKATRERAGSEPKGRGARVVVPPAAGVRVDPRDAQGDTRDAPEPDGEEEAREEAREGRRKRGR